MNNEQMLEFDSLHKHLNNLDSLSEEEVDRVVSCFKKRVVKKRQFIIQPDFTANHRFYVDKGAFRAYVIGNDGQEHTISLAVEDWWITDINSFIYRNPATMIVEALEDSIVFHLDHESEIALKGHSHAIEGFFRKSAERGLAFMQRRLISTLTLSAEDRYEELVKSYPQFLERFPQYVIASYLGMTTEYLSRIRNKKAKS